MAIRIRGWPLPRALVSISDLFKRQQQKRKTFLLIFSKAQVAENRYLCVPSGPWLSYTLLTKIKFASKTLVLLFTMSPSTGWQDRMCLFIFFKTLLAKIETGKYGLLLNLALKGLSKILLAFPSQILTLISRVFLCIFLCFRKGGRSFQVSKWWQQHSDGSFLNSNSWPLGSSTCCVRT